jgi:glutaredoxin 3
MPTAVTLFHTSTCPFCTQAERLLARHGRRSLPQIFIGSQHVGGFDDLLELERRGDLAPLLQIV